MTPQLPRSLMLTAVLVFLAATYLSGTAETLRSSGNRLGIRRFVTPAISPAWRVGQRFTMNTDGLHAITVRTERLADPAGRVRFELRSITRHAPIAVREIEVPAADLVRSTTYTFEFPPINDSRDVAYQLDVRSSADAPSGGVALWASRGATLADGTLLINAAERWAELAFETKATQTGWANAKAWTVLALLGLGWAAFVAVWREIIGQA
jgi:hypothetical protein